MRVPSPVRVLQLYGAFLMVGGLLAFAMAGFEARAKTAILMGGGCGLVMLACAWMGSHGRPTALRLGRGLALFFLVVFAFRGYKIRDVAEKQYLLYTFVWLSLGSIVAAALLSLSPELRPVGARRAEAVSAKNSALNRGQRKVE